MSISNTLKKKKKKLKGFPLCSPCFLQNNLSNFILHTGHVLFTVWVFLLQDFLLTALKAFVLPMALTTNRENTTRQRKRSLWNIKYFHL